ncbi:MAG: hypothetical protein K8L99_34335 [Anaerolineae bacterium]|nr:hypothetical protein [Anaerolineae bacterium]
METILAAVFAVFLILFAMLNLTQAMLTTQDTLQVSWQEMNERLDQNMRTMMIGDDGYTSQNGSQISLLLSNQGSTRLADYDTWDAIVQYYDAADDYHIEWLSYGSGWAITGLYIDYDAKVGEAFDPGIWNPDEEAFIQFSLSPAVGPGAAIQFTLVSEDGASVTEQFLGNQTPTLILNVPLVIASGGTGTIDASYLQATDPDDEDDDLLYIVVDSPTQGQLTPNMTFTQGNINDGLLSYAHTGSGNDSFTLNITDGKDTVGVYTYNITVNLPPTLAQNQPLNTTSMGSWQIDNTYLQVTDPDSAAGELVYTVSVQPEKGTLNLGDSFTQADIDSGMLSYTRSGTGVDAFQFTVTDGYNTIGNYTFLIVE